MVLLAVTADTWIVTGLGFGIVLALLFCLVYILRLFGWIMQKTTAPKAPKPAPAPAAPAAKAAGAGEHAINAPMPGKILKVLVKEGQQVKAGENMMMLEAMKMQNEILADADATVKAVNVAEGQTVKAGDALIILG